MAGLAGLAGSAGLASPVAVGAATIAVEASPVDVEASPVAVEASPIALEAPPMAGEAAPIAGEAPVHGNSMKFNALGGSGRRLRRFLETCFIKSSSGLHLGSILGAFWDTLM